MSNIIFKSKLTLLFLFTCLLGISSCSKIDEDTKFSVNVRITNYRNEAVYFYVDKEVQATIGSNKEYSTAIILTNKNAAIMSIQTATGDVLSTKNVTEGDSYVVVLNKETSDNQATDINSEWKLPVKVTNATENNVIVYVGGQKYFTVRKGESINETATIINQNSVKVEIRSESGSVISSKECPKGSSFDAKSVVVIIANIFNNKTLQVYCDGKLYTEVKGGESSNTYTFITQKKLFEIKDANNNLLDSKTINDTDVYFFDSKDPQKAYIFVENLTNDNYEISIDETFITILPPKSEIWISTTSGSHKLKAKQKDGYILWATVEEKNIICSTNVYTWDFTNGTFEKTN